MFQNKKFLHIKLEKKKESRTVKRLKNRKKFNLILNSRLSEHPENEMSDDKKNFFFFKPVNYPFFFIYH